MPYGRTVRHYRGRVLKQLIGSRGYPEVKLSRNGHEVTRPVHQLVAAAFLPPRREGQEVRHGPNGKLDCRASELCWGTRSENIRDRTRDGQDNRGERYGMTHLTWAKVAVIRQRVAAGESQRVVARDYDIHFATVNCIVLEKTWKLNPA